MNRIQTELLLRKVQSGDTGALDTLITAYYPQILNYCRWHTADEQQAQDAAQETFLKAVRWLDSCGGFQGAFRPFLYKIAKNICIDLNRTMKRTEVSLESLPDEPAYQESGFAAVRAIIGTAERSATGGGRAGALYGVAVHPACRPVRIYCRSLKGASHGTENSEYYKAIPG